MSTRSAEAIAYDDWADYYDLIEGDRAPYVGFYGSLLDGRARSVLELGCGTGTILSSLGKRLRELAPANAALRLVGIDASSGMLRLAQDRDSQVEWLQGDMREPQVAGQFDFAFCCFNTLQFLPRDEDLDRAFASMRALLADDGRFAFDLYQPNEAWLGVARMDQGTRHTVDAHGRIVEVREDARYDPDTRLLSLQWRLVERDNPDAQPIARTAYQLRQYYPHEVERLLSEAGLAIVERFGDLDRSPFEANSRKQVYVCARA